MSTDIEAATEESENAPLHAPASFVMTGSQ